MRVKLGMITALVALTAMVSAATVAPAATAAPRTATLTAIPVSGVIQSVNGTFAGTANITSFAIQNGQLVANGTLTGNLLGAAGNTIGTVTNVPITLPVGQAPAAGGCQILDLTLGPLDLNLLGLVVHLDTVHLNITAQPGPGNLLGNLLCSVAHLLDNTNASQNALQNLLNTLNQIIAGLGL
jgi:hypothetical protein